MCQSNNAPDRRVLAILEPMPRLGVRDGDPLTVELLSAPITSWDDLWDALTGPCGLPEWFGRNLDAWEDTLGTGAISDVLDAHPFLIVRVLGQGLSPPATVTESDSSR